MTADLLPCPFCGSVVVSREGFHMSCIRCGADGAEADEATDEAAAAAWNRRAAQCAAEAHGVTVADILAEFDRRAEPGTGFYEPEEPAQIIRAMLAANPQPKGMVLSDEQIFAAWNRASGIAEAGERRLAFGREVERLTLSAQAPASDAPDENVERWREVLQKAAQTVSGFGNFFAGSKHREPVGSKMHQHYANWAKQATEMVNELMDLSDEIRDTLGDDHE